MKVVYILILLLLILLAVSSGVSKIMLMPHEVEFFGQYGFTRPILLAFGLAQAIGGLLMVLTRTRFAGAAIVAMTFLISLIVVLKAGNIPMGIVTLIATLLLGVIMKQSWPSPSR